MIKKGLMRAYWRVQQSQTLISMVFWVTTLTLISWPYVSWRFDHNSEFLGISMTYWGLSSISVFVIFCVLVIGYMYDVIFSLWRAHQSVIQERNPYTTYMVNGPFHAVLGQTNEILKRLSDGDKDLIAHTEFIDRWLAWNGEQELMKRTVTGMKEVMLEADPALLHINDKNES